MKMENLQELPVENDQKHRLSAIRSRASEPVIEYGNIYTSYRHLLHNLSLQFTQDNLESVAYLRLIPEQVSTQGRLAVLTYLDQRGEIAWNSIDSLHALLQEIHRIDLVHSHLRPYELTLERYISQDREKEKDWHFSHGMYKILVRNCVLCIDFTCLLWRAS